MRRENVRPWTEVPDALAHLLRDQFDIGAIKRDVVTDHPALGWRRSGLMAVTGRADGPALVCPAALTTFADAALSALRRLSASTALPANGAMLLGERARLLGLQRQGTISANGSCRLVACADGTIALNLPREDDWSLAEAMVQQPAGDWEALTAALRTWPRASIVQRGRLLGLAVAADDHPASSLSPLVVERCASLGSVTKAAPLVVDLSALWAGPLAGGLLAASGARVIKVESTRRPDGARGGDRGFWALLNGRKEEVALDFHDKADLQRLRGLVREADIIIEASRPRALRALGIDARVEAARGATWLSITAYGREGEAGEAIGFGDDTAVAGGLSQRLHAVCGETLFAGDAIADPLTGILAALAGWAGWRSGGGRIVSLAMANVVAFASRFGARSPADAAAWQQLALADEAPLYPLRSD